MEQLTEYLLFLAKTVTILIAFIIPIMVISALAMRQRQQQKEHLEVNKLNRRYEAMSNTIDSVQLPKKAFKDRMKKQKKGTEILGQKRDGRRKKKANIRLRV